ncbi:MAG: ferritin-like domain-containing protein, partial [Candidatus Promineifilaceae bacterium]|nr:ferritin-like domain-containing protein [Candidatus Promineifilaceae bacterium]
MSIMSLQDVYIDQLKDMYSAEKQLTEALPRMVQAASSKDLQKAFQNHLQKTQMHLNTVQEILHQLDENPTSSKCEAMEGLIAEGDEIAKEDGNADARDAALIVAAQKVEHYEIASYGSLRTLAESLGYGEAAQTLQGILNDEYEADQELDDLAMGIHHKPGINAE